MTHFPAELRGRRFGEGILMRITCLHYERTRLFVFLKRLLKLNEKKA